MAAHPPLPKEVSPPQPDWVYRPLRRSLPSTFSSSTFSPHSSSPSIAQIIMPSSAPLPTNNPRLLSPMHYPSYDPHQRMSQSAPHSGSFAADQSHAYYSAQYAQRSQYMHNGPDTSRNASWAEGAGLLSSTASAPYTPKQEFGSYESSENCLSYDLVDTIRSPHNSSYSPHPLSRTSSNMSYAQPSVMQYQMPSSSHPNYEMDTAMYAPNVAYSQAQSTVPSHTAPTSDLRLERSSDAMPMSFSYGYQPPPLAHSPTDSAYSDSVSPLLNACDPRHIVSPPYPSTDAFPTLDTRQTYERPEECISGSYASDTGSSPLSMQYPISNVYDTGESEMDDVDEGDDEFLAVGGQSRGHVRSSSSPASARSSSRGAIARTVERLRRATTLTAPVPVPNLTKKSRGRRVPTKPTVAIHDGSPKHARTYMCKVDGCGKCFARGEHLKRHVRSIHTHEKPYACPVAGCGKGFSRHDNLGQHMRVHKGFELDGED